MYARLLVRSVVSLALYSGRYLDAVGGGGGGGGGGRAVVSREGL